MVRLHVSSVHDQLIINYAAEYLKVLFAVSSRIPKLLDEDTSYWTGASVTWAMNQDGHGYWYTIGDL